MSDAMYDVRPDQYPTVIREMIRHENDVTNHRIMWLLIGQEFIANAYVSVKSDPASANLLLGLAGMLISLSAFVMLYRQLRRLRSFIRFFLPSTGRFPPSPPEPKKAPSPGGYAAEPQLLGTRAYLCDAGNSGVGGGDRIRQ